MNRAANKMMQTKQNENSDASLRLEKNFNHQLPNEVYEIARLLAKITVEKYFDELSCDIK